MKNNIQILQCGYPKSGNYLLYKIFSSILKNIDNYHTVTLDSGLKSIFNSFCSDYMTFPEVNEIDNIRLINDKIYLEIPHPDLRFIPINQNILKYSTIVWTHEQIDNILKILPNTTHFIYLVRDGRDVINSAIHYVTSDTYLKLRPENKIISPEKLYSDSSYFKHVTLQWTNHVRSYLNNREKLLLIKYEELIKNKKTVIKNILNYIGIDLNDSIIEDIIIDTSFNSMSKEAPKHLRKGHKNDWKNFFTKEHIDIFNAVAKNELIELGYIIESK